MQLEKQCKHFYEEATNNQWFSCCTQNLISRFLFLKEGDSQIPTDLRNDSYTTQEMLCNVLESGGHLCHKSTSCLKLCELALKNQWMNAQFFKGLPMAYFVQIDRTGCKVSKFPNITF